jgi:hypothetical protein
MLFHIVNMEKFEYFIDAETAGDALQAAATEEADDKDESWVVSSLEVEIDDEDEEDEE